MKEIWKKVNDFNYSVSNLGRVKNLKSNQILKPQKNLYGYEILLLYKNGKPKMFQVHRLVLMTFNPIENQEKLQVNHIDHNRQNNKLSNLEWVTAKENCKNRKLKKYYNSKGCYDNFGNYFSSYREAGRFYNISANTVKNDCLRKNKKNRDFSRKKKTSNFSFLINLF